MVRERTKKLELAYRKLEERNWKLEDLLKKVAHLEAIKNQMVMYSD